MIADALSQMGPGFRGRHPDLPHKDIAGMRVELAHIYWDADFDIVWDTLTDSVPELVNTVGDEYAPPSAGPSPLDENVAIPRMIPPPPHPSR